VREALTNDSWLEDIQSYYSVAVLSEYLDVWDLLQEVVLQPGVEDVHKWRFEASGVSFLPNQRMKPSSMDQSTSSPTI
jgi:hypothetical protein